MMLWLGCGLAGDWSAADNPPVGMSQDGVLVLRTGRVLSGTIQRVGDRYRVVLGGQDEVGVPVDSVELHAATLAEAYQMRVRNLRLQCTAAEHLALADWCVRYELWNEAGQELAAARGVEPDNPSIDALERRLRLASRPSPPQPLAAPPMASPSAAPVDLDQFCRDLPPGTIETFTNQVQPLLINRCGAGGCHGPRSESQFQIVHPSTNRALPRPVTQRNLYAAMRYVDRQNPATSPLLVKAMTPHGTSLRAPVSERDRLQFAHLVNWVQRAIGQPSPSALPLPSSPAPSPTTAQRKGTAVQPASAPIKSATDTSATVPRAGAAPASPAPSRDAAHAAEADPFDPEIFNRRHREPAQ